MWRFRTRRVIRFSDWGEELLGLFQQPSDEYPQLCDLHEVPTRAPQAVGGVGSWNLHTRPPSLPSASRVPGPWPRLEAIQGGTSSRSFRGTAEKSPARTIPL